MSPFPTVFSGVHVLACRLGPLQKVVTVVCEYRPQQRVRSAVCVACIVLSSGCMPRDSVSMFEICPRSVLLEMCPRLRCGAHYILPNLARPSLVGPIINRPTVLSHMNRCLSTTDVLITVLRVCRIVGITCCHRVRLPSFQMTQLVVCQMCRDPSKWPWR